MAQKLLEYYEEAKKMGGLVAAMRLAVLTRISGPKAKTEPDTPEYIARFEAAMLELKKEFKKE